MMLEKTQSAVKRHKFFLKENNIPRPMRFSNLSIPAFRPTASFINCTIILTFDASLCVVTATSFEVTHAAVQRQRVHNSS